MLMGIVSKGCRINCKTDCRQDVKKKERVDNEVGQEPRSRSIERQDRERVGGREREGRGRRDRELDEQQTSAAYEQDRPVGNRSSRVTEQLGLSARCSRSTVFQ